ncbi:hypothetical protein ACX3OY_24615 [Citrobacter farmeri]
MKKFLVIDPFIHKEEHYIVDRAFLEYFSKFESLVLVNDTLKKKCLDLDLSFLPSFSDSRSNSNLSRWLFRECFKVIYTVLVLLANVLPRRRVVFLAMSQFQFFIFSLVCFVFRFKVSIVMHHYAECLIKPKSELTFSERLFFIGYRVFNRLSDVRFLYLSKHIKNAIPDSDKNYYINHPIPLSMIRDVPIDKIGLQNDEINIATIGLLSSSRKNSHFINKLIYNEKYNLWVIGRFAKNEEFTINKSIRSQLWNGMYTSVEFREAISNIDCFVYFFDKEQYRCTASGTLIDAILYNKFVISLRNVAAESLLSNYNKKIFFSSLEEMNSFLRGNSLEAFIRNGKTYADPRVSYCLMSQDFIDVEVLENWLA